MAEPTLALVPLDERRVDFYGDAVVAVLVEETGRPQIYVPLRPICEYLGIAWAGQFTRIKDDEVLAEALRSVKISLTERGERTMLCLPLDYLPAWLFMIKVGHVKAELREKITRYRRECVRVLAQAFQAEALVLVGGDRIPRDDTDLAQIRALGLAIARMAEEQMIHNARLDTQEARLNRAAQVVTTLGHRLTALEHRLDGGAYLTEEQAAALAAQVKALAVLLTGRDPSKNHFQGIFTELYRRFRVSEYKHIRQSQFPDVRAFLDEWQEAVMQGNTMSD